MTKPLVVVTGASHGIGHATAAAFAADGHPVLVVARHPESMPEIAGTVRRVAADVADAPALMAAIAEAEAAFGPVDCLVNNAGFVRIGAFQDRDPSAMSYEVDVLLKGVLYGMRAVLPGMIARRGGTIINISSIGDRTPGPMGEVYHACKAAVRSLAQSMQKGQAANNVRVVNVAPGLVRTNIHADMGITFEAYCEMLGNPTFISAAELADIVLFCYRQPPQICIRDIVVMPTDCAFA